ncbi:MAG: endolytic transglycosylase MltG [Marinifilaceae bacterium]
MKKKAALTAIILFFILVSAGGYILHALLLRPAVSVSDDGIIYIDKTDTYEIVLDKLIDKGYINNPYMLNQVAKLKKYPALVKPGRYQIRDGMTNVELIDYLRRGEQTPILFTFNNIRNINEFASVAQKELSTDSAEIVTLLQDTAFLKELKFTPHTITAIILPNTYQITWKPTAKQLILRMYQEYGRFWNVKRREKANEIGLTPVEVTTLASIIEEETTKAFEYPIIAGVYINRLKKGINLAACPTVKYALNDFTLKRILTKHLEIKSPYNTYINAGLPPGPIRIASIQVIDAVLNYTKHDYLFFCAKSDLSGTHHFSKTLSQHNKYAREYHEMLNNKGIYK